MPELLGPMRLIEFRFGPRRERAVQRQEFLRDLFTVRDSFFYDPPRIEVGLPTLAVGWPGARLGPDGEVIQYSRLPLSQAAALLGVSEDGDRHAD